MIYSIAIWEDTQLNEAYTCFSSQVRSDAVWSNMNMGWCSFCFYISGKKKYQIRCWLVISSKVSNNQYCFYANNTHTWYNNHQQVDSMFEINPTTLYSCKVFNTNRLIIREWNNIWKFHMLIWVVPANLQLIESYWIFERWTLLTTTA